jgi:hypothetical protein
VSKGTGDTNMKKYTKYLVKEIETNAVQERTSFNQALKNLNNLEGKGLIYGLFYNPKKPKITHFINGKHISQGHYCNDWALLYTKEV